MHFEPTFRIHMVDPLGFQDMPVIVTTAFTTHNGLPKGEWFLVIPEGEGILFAQRTMLQYPEIPEGPVTFDDAFLLDEVFDQAKLRLRRYIFETKGEEARALLSRPLSVMPSNQNLFVSLWMSNRYRSCLTKIHAKTQCARLSELLGWVLDLPMLDNIDLSD